MGRALNGKPVVIGNVCRSPWSFILLTEYHTDLCFVWLISSAQLLHSHNVTFFYYPLFCSDAVVGTLFGAIVYAFM